MSGHERSFVYALDAVRQRAQHRLDAAAHAVSSAHRTLLGLEDARQALAREHECLAASMMPAAHAPIDPRLTASQTGYLAYLWRRIAALDAEINRIRPELARARDAAQACRTDVEVFERHREQQMRAHAATQAARTATDADQDWLARSAWRSGQVARSTAGVVRAVNGKYSR